MKSFLANRSNRHGYCGWTIVDGHGIPLPWTTSTTRQECRQITKDRPDIFGQGRLFERKFRIVKVKINVEVV